MRHVSTPVIPMRVEETVATGATNAVGRFHPRSRVRVGETIEVAVAIENLHFFDHETHQAIWA